MSYTAPQYVDTKEQAILALASTIKGEAVTGGDGSVNRALDVLADVLAEQDVQVPQTDAGAILALAQYVSGGGGGSSDFTTAHVTITSTAGDVVLNALMVCTYAMVGGTIPTSMPIPAVPGAPAEFDAILYKGTAVLNFNYSGDFEISGAIQQKAEGVYAVTGDCTIAITSAPK